MSRGLVAPPPLRPGDTLAVFAGSSPFDRLLALRGMAFLRERYRVVFSQGLFDRRAYLAGTDARRRDELRGWLDHEGVKALVAARGGYGLSRVVGDVDWAAFSRAPRWIAGFSDVTALHVEAARVGVRSIHGPNAASVGRADRAQRESLVAALEGAETPTLRGLQTVVGGVAEGVLFGGNLTLLHACAAAGRLEVPEGAVLLLEDVTERPYRIDRMLTTLRGGGHFDRVAGVVVGTFTDCKPGPDGATVEEVVRDCLAALGVPVVSGAPIGHGAENVAVVLGGRVRVGDGELRASS